MYSPRSVKRPMARSVILERMTQRQILTLALVVAADGQAVRSNYSGIAAAGGRWPVYWKSLDWLVASGLVLRVGKHYSPTIRGEELAKQARVRRWA
jgi:hypothetical protein